mgnify:FL=1
MKFIIVSLKTSLRKYFDFKGRATRSEFWIFVIFYWLFLIASILIFYSLEFYYISLGKSLIVTDIYDTQIMKEYDENFEIAFTIVILLPVIFFIIPYTSLAVRRLHDIGKSGYYAIIIFLLWMAPDFYFEYYPVKGDFVLTSLIAILVYIYLSKKGFNKKNKYGPVPKKIK